MNQKDDKECKECGEWIGLGRLKARPKTELCIECQTKLEKKGGFVRHKMNITAVMKAGEIDSLEEIFYRGSEA